MTEAAVMTREEAKQVVGRLGPALALHYEEAIEITMRGWPTWRIAQHYRLSPELIHELGGPVPKGS